MRPWRVAGLSLLAFVTACSLFLDTAEFAANEPPADGSTPDGSSPADTSAPGDDGGGTTDAPSDAPPIDAGGCDGATFCDSFDDDAAIGTRWTSVVTLAAPPLAYDDAAVSPPNSVRLDLPARDSGLYRRAQLKKGFSPFPQSVTCSMQLYVAVGVTGGAEGYGLFTFAPSNDPSGYLIELKIKPGNTLRIEESNNTGANVLTTSGTVPISLGQWHTVTVTTDFTNASFVVDGVQASLSVTNRAAATADGGSPALLVALGEDSDVDLEAFLARFDDFSCTVTP